MTLLERATCAIYGEDNLDGLGDIADRMKQRVRLALAALREPTHAITKAMAESRATDDEGQFEIMLDLLDFSGENKTHTVLAQAWRDGIDAILKDG
jgi:hypothetical protein